MSTNERPKDTSYPYGEAYQREQVEKHRQRHSNHWRNRISLAHSLVDRWALPRLGKRAPGEIKVLDVGCSIGTMTIEFAARGFATTGVDFDAAAIEIARELCREEGVDAQFWQGDVADLERPAAAERFDIVLCFDIFEHLHDDELGGLLRSIKRLMSDKGSLIFYSYPLQYDYIFFSRDFLSWPLIPFRWLGSRQFDAVTRAYAAVLDAGLLLCTGKTYRERIKMNSHCNPTTPARLQDILLRAGYEIATMETANLYPFKRHIKRLFGRHAVAHRQVYGVAYPAARG